MTKKISMRSGLLLACAVVIAACGEQGVLDSSSDDSAAAGADASSDAPSMEPAVVQAPQSRAAAEECCTEVGKMDQCWWEDAALDGVVCRTNGDCPGFTCQKEVGASLGVCRCSTNANCKNGVCFDRDGNGSPDTCGPSYCNGYLQCSCFGGCTWWHSDETYTPTMEAASDGLLCCEGNYPAGGDELIAYYSNSGDCVGGGGPTPGECATNGDCNDGKECTTDTCLANGTCQRVSNTGTVCGVGVESCGEGLCNTIGDCVFNPYTAGTACGDDHAGDECQNPDACDGAGVCITTNYVAAGTLCGSDNAGVECLGHDECDGAGACVNNPDPVGTACTLDTNLYPAICWDGACGNSATSIPNGVCEASLLSAGNDTCATALHLGTFGAADTGPLPGGPWTGSLDCALNNYSAGGEDCLEWASVNRLGANTKDVVYSFDYTTPDTTDPAVDHQLYAFIIRLESNVAATLYTYSPADDACPAAGVVAGNRCISQHAGDGTNPYVWEHMANVEGNWWVGVHQECSATPGSGYWWCDRGAWSYPADITPCNNGVCATTTAYPQGNMSQAVVYPRGVPDGDTHRVYVFVDGAGAANGVNDNGEFSLTVEKIPLNNGPCERINDDQRVYDITEVEVGGSQYVGNFEGVANSDHDHSFSTACGMYDCGSTWTGVTASHDVAAATELWPDQVHFKVHRPVGVGSQRYCVRTETPDAGAVDTVVEVRAQMDDFDICGSDYVPVGDADGNTGVSFVAAEGVLYNVMLSEMHPRAASCVGGSNSCNYKLVVEEGDCPFPGGITTTADCVASPVIPNSCTALGITGSPPAGQIFASNGDGTYAGRITTECSNIYNLISGIWPGIGGLESLHLLTNDTPVAKEVTIKSWDHSACAPEYCGAGTNYWFTAAYTCEGSLVDWYMSTSGAGDVLPPDTCVDTTSKLTYHTFKIPPFTTYQFIASTSPTDSLEMCDSTCSGGPTFVCSGTMGPIRGIWYGLQVSWADTTIDPTPQGSCESGGYEYPVGSGICWYQGTPSLSCDSVCAGYGACNPTALTDYVGGAGVCGAACQAHCASIINGLHGTALGTVPGNVYEGTGVGCALRNLGASSEYIMDWEATTCEGAHTVIARVCACDTLAPVACTPGEQRCVGLNREVCDAAQTWQFAEHCDWACDMAQGGCYGSCLPGSTQAACFNGTTEWLCDANFSWQLNPCTYACVSGACGGVCVPDSDRCAVGGLYQVCDTDGQWQTAVSCPYGCNADLVVPPAAPPGACYGVCAAGVTECVDADHQRTCGATYTWGPDEYCPSGCSAGSCVNACDTGGHYVGGYCWYEGLEGQNCTTVCAAGARGGYNADGTLGFAGSGGTDANCQLVLDEFGYTSPVATTIANAFGCSRNTATSVNRRGTVATTESSSDASYRRMCACNAGSVECTPGATRCNGSTFETCNAAGYWATTDACTFGCNGTTGCYGNCNPATYVETCPTTHISRQCVDYTVTDVSCANPPTTYACQSATGLCGGVCTPGVKRCSANGSDFAVQICTSEGQWNTTVPVEICDFGCDASDQGAPTFCFGECTPLVDGDFCTDDFTATSCVGYFWVPSVCTGQACVDATGQCGGVCVPQTDRCSVKQYQYCDGDGAWVSPAAGLCPFGCDATLTTYTGPYADACYGVCNTGNTRCVLPTTTYREIQACDGAGLTWGTISNCANACVGDVCGGVCIPGQRRCTTEGTGYDVEVCNSSGQWDVAAPVENCSFGCDQSDQGAASFCYGECLPGSVECVDAGNERTCQIDYTWGAAEFCAGGCDLGGTEECLPQCDPGTVLVGGYCWVASAVGGNCTTACAGHGGYNAATNTYAGNSGTDAQCLAVLAALGYSTGFWHGYQTWNPGFGCGTWNGVSDRIRMGGGVTTEGFSWAGNVRACACNNGSMECTPGATRCSANVFETCNASGFWATTATCPNGCNNTTGCYGDCNPASYVETCPTTATSRQCVGYFETDVNCVNPPATYACQSATGLCGGVCTPGERLCMASGDDFNVLLCTSEGQWDMVTPAEVCDFGCDDSDQGAASFCYGECTPAVDPAFCPDDFNSTACVGYYYTTSSCSALGQSCVNATGLCGGSCVFQTDRCTGLQYQYCDGDGNWVSPPAGLCPFGCNAGLITYTGPYADACYGSCVSGSTRCVVPDATYRQIQTCDGAGLTWGSIANCANACVGDVCGGVCVPGTEQCSGSQYQYCDSTGQWQSPAAGLCPYGCNAALAGATPSTPGGACYGNCTPNGARQCNASSNVDTCTDYSWVQTEVCTSGCSSGACIVVDPCAPDGEMVGTHCWWRGNDNQSCTEVCSTRSGYSSYTETYAGASGTDANCRSVATAFGWAVPPNYWAGYNTWNPMGCAHYNGGVNDLGRFGPTSPEGSKVSGYRRYCACKQGQPAECTPGQTQCYLTDFKRTCDINGFWGTPVSCTACANNGTTCGAACTNWPANSGVVPVVGACYTYIATWNDTVQDMQVNNTGTQWPSVTFSWTSPCGGSGSKTVSGQWSGSTTFGPTGGMTCNTTVTITAVANNPGGFSWY